MAGLMHLIGYIGGSPAYVTSTTPNTTGRGYYDTLYWVVNSAGEEIYSPHGLGRGVGVCSDKEAVRYLLCMTARHFMEAFTPEPGVTRYSDSFQRGVAFSYPSSWGIGLLTDGSDDTTLLFPRVGRAFHLRLRHDGPTCWAEVNPVDYAAAAAGLDLDALARDDQRRFGSVGDRGRRLDG